MTRPTERSSRQKSTGIEFFEGGAVLCDAARTARTRNDGRHHRIGERELQACSLYADAVAIGDRLDPRHFVEDFRRRRRIFEVRTADERARTVGTADDDGELMLRNHRHHPLKRSGMVEKRITACEQEAVGARTFQREQQFDRLDPVDARVPTP